MRIFFATRLQTLLAFGEGGGVITDTSEGCVMDLASMRNLLTSNDTCGYAVVTDPDDERQLASQLAPLEPIIVGILPDEADGSVVLLRLDVQAFEDEDDEKGNRFVAPLADGRFFMTQVYDG